MLRIGITGHRWNKLPADFLATLETRLKTEFLILDAERQPTTLVCGMAEATDMIAARLAPALWELEAVLALPKEQWRAHLRDNPDGKEGDVEIFDYLIGKANIVTSSDPPQKPDYSWVANHIVQSCSVLIAVWDGQPGGVGGTSDVVARALSRNLQVIHILVSS